jgi:hypothetical protein
MKFAAYILALYLAILSITPCCTFDDCPEDKVATNQVDDHQDGDEDCGNCSPFFNCNGCSSSFVDFPNSSFQYNAQFSPRRYTSFLQPYFPEVHYEFWQPPKLA